MGGQIIVNVILDTLAPRPPVRPRPPVGSTNEAVRTAWIERTLQTLPAGWRILDAGAGEQPYRRHCAHLDYVAQDVARYDGEGDGAGLHTGQWNRAGLDIICDITNIPEPDASYDAILCTEVLEHLPNPLSAIDEFCRLLKPHGHLIVTAPFCSLTHFAPEHFATGFSRYFYQTHLEQRGFEIVDLAYNGNYFEYIAQEIRRLSGVASQYAAAHLSRADRRAIDQLLATLQRCSDADAGSHDLLHFGCHVHAVRKAA